MEFKIGDKVVYPNHGVGVIEQVDAGLELPASLDHLRIVLRRRRLFGEGRGDTRHRGQSRSEREGACPSRALRQTHHVHQYLLRAVRNKSRMLNCR